MQEILLRDALGEQMQKLEVLLQKIRRRHLIVQVQLLQMHQTFFHGAIANNI